MVSSIVMNMDIVLMVAAIINFYCAAITAPLSTNDIHILDGIKRDLLISDP